MEWVEKKINKKKITQLLYYNKKILYSLVFK